MESGRSSASSDSTELQGRMEQDSPILINGHNDNSPYGDSENGDRPCLEIIEQPQARGFRFRYECEGPSHGGLQGERSRRNRKTFPVIKIHNYSGNARVVVTLVTDEPVPRPHAHKLVGKHCNNGVCIVQLKPGQREIQFPNLCVQHITRKKAADVLAQRIMDSMLLDKKIHCGDFKNTMELKEEEEKHAKSEAEMQAKTMQLNVVRLCFQAYLQDNQGQIIQVLPSQISNPIFDSKAPGANALKICRMDKYGGCCSGGEEVFLLCEKVQKDDIQVLFVEQDKNGETVWQAFGVFGPHDVHRQYAIVFKTPPYKDTNIDKPVNVLIMLQRKTDTEVSDPKSFTFYPQSHDKEDINRKRRKTLPSDPRRGGFGDMDHSNDIFGGRDDSSKGGGTDGTFMNGPQGAGSIPDFSNLQSTLSGYGNPNNPGVRFQDPSGRQHQAGSFMTNNLRQASNMYSPHTIQIKAESTDMNQQYGGLSHPYQNNGRSEVLPGLSHPIKINPNSPPQNMATSPVNHSMTTDPCGRAGQQMANMHSPNNYMTGGHSPQHQAGYMHANSPQNAGSPMMNVGSPQMAHTNLQVPQMSQGADASVLSGSFNVNATTSQASFPMTDMGRGNNVQGVLSQPIQVEELSSLETDSDFVQKLIEELSDTRFCPELNQSNFNFGANVPPVNNDYTQSSNPFNPYNSQTYFFQARGSSTCGLQSREATGGMHEQVKDSALGFDFIDGKQPAVGYDEVDSCRIDRLMIDEQAQAGPDLLSQVKSDPYKTQDNHTYVKSVQVEPCSETETEIGRLKQEYESVLTPKHVTEEKTHSPRETENPKVVAVTQETQYGVASRTSTAVQVDLRQQNYTALKDMESVLKTAKKTSQALQYYAASGDIRYLLMVQRYLMLVQDINGDLPLHTALINEKYEVFQNLLDVMATLPDAHRRINAFNHNYQTPLHLAVLTNQPGAIILLIRAGADPTLVDRNGCTAAHLAVKYGKNECLAALLHYFRKGCVMEEPFPELNIRCYDGYTPAHIAAQQEDLVAMKLLVHGKADINMADGKSGKTPLHHVVEVDELSIAAYLILQAGANVNMKRFDGNTPLHVACGRENVGMVALLMAGGADPEAENDDVEFFDDLDDVSDDSDNNDTNNDEADNGNQSTECTQRSEKEIKPLSDILQDVGVIQESEGRTGSESEESDEDDRMGLKTGFHGLTPADFVGTNDKILRILNGEPYISLRDINSSDGDQRLEQTTSILSSLRLTSKESGISSMGFHSKVSDMEKIDYDTRVILSKLLDPCKTGCDWLALADRLGLKKMMEGQIGNHSPTRLLLTYFEACGGTVSSLSNALSDIKRTDALDILSGPDSHTSHRYCSTHCVDVVDISEKQKLNCKKLPLPRAVFLEGVKRVQYQCIIWKTSSVINPDKSMPDNYELDKDIQNEGSHDSGLESLNKPKSTVTT